jgi:Flp pilus assembly protein TadB
MGVAVAVTACAFGIALDISPAWIVLGAGVIGILMPQWFIREQNAKTRGSKTKDEVAQP